MNRAAAALAVPLFAIATIEPGLSVGPPAMAPVTIPFELTLRHIIVKVKVNNSRPLAFLLDTGANAAIIRIATATELGLSLQGSVNAGGAGAGTQAGRRVKDAKWSLVGLDRFSQPVSLALPLTVLTSGLGREIDGIIGGEFIKQFVLELDYQARTITLHDRQAFAYKGKGHTLPLDFNADGHPVVKATVTPVGGKPIEDRFALDIGSGLALALHSPFVVEHDLLGPQARTIRAIGMTGAGGRSTGRVGRVAALQIGPFTISNPIALFSQDKAGAFADPSLGGNIGFQVANRFRTVLDYGRRQIILEPSPAFAEPFDRAFSGLVVRAEGPTYRVFRVTEVLEDSPATEAGLAPGDIVTSIDGVAAESLTLAGISEALEKPAAHEMTIRRAEQIMKITITPRKLV